MLTPKTAKHLHVTLKIENDSLVDALAFHQNTLAIATRDGTLYTLNITDNTRTDISNEAGELRALSYVGEKLFSAHPHGIYHWSSGAAQQVTDLDTRSLAACNGQLVSGGEDGSIRFWDTESYQELNTLATLDSAIQKVACHESQIVAVSQTTVMLWNIDSGVSQEIASANARRRADIHQNKVAVVVGDGDRTELYVYDLAGNLLWEQKERFLQDVLFSPDGVLLVTPNTTLQGNQVWAAETGALVTRASYPSKAVFSPDGNALVFGGQNRLEVLMAQETPASRGGIAMEAFSAKVLDNVKQIGELHGHGGEILSLDFHPTQPHILASVGSDSAVIIWDTSTGETVYVLDNLGPLVKSVKYTPDGQHMLVGEGDFTNQAKAHFLDAHTYTPTGRTLTQRASGFPHLAVSGSNVALKYTIFDLESGDVVHELTGHKAGTNEVAFSHDGTYFGIAVGSDTGMSGNVDNAVKVYEVATGEIVHDLRKHNDWVMQVSFGPPHEMFGELVRGVDARGMLYGWRLDNGQLLAGGDGITAVGNPPDPSIGVVANRDKSLRLLDFSGGGGDGVKLEGHTDVITCIVINKDGTLMASGSKDRSIRLWGVAPTS